MIKENINKNNNSVANYIINNKITNYLKIQQLPIIINNILNNRRKIKSVNDLFK